MKENFDGALSYILKHEGGYVDHPEDPGGATNLGITIGTLSKWLGRTATKAEVKTLTVEKVSPIYRKGYWNAVRADDLPAGVDYCTFDATVNSGPTRGAKWLQRAVGVEADGEVGALTLKAARGLPAVTIINRMCDDRLDYLQGLPTWGTFGKGWKARVAGVRKEALAMASATAIPPPDIPCTDPAPVPPIQPASSGLFAALLSLLKRIFA